MVTICEFAPARSPDAAQGGYSRRRMSHGSCSRLHEGSRWNVVFGPELFPFATESKPINVVVFPSVFVDFGSIRQCCRLALTRENVVEMNAS